MALTIEMGYGAARAVAGIQRPRSIEPSIGSGSAAEFGSLLALLDAVDYGLMLVTDEAVLIHANASATRELDDARILELQARVVRPCDDARLPAFMTSVHRAALGFRSLTTLGSGPTAGPGPGVSLLASR